MDNTNALTEHGREGLYRKLELVQWHQVAMLEPVNRPNGRSATRLHYNDGSYDHLACTCELALRYLANYYHTDVRYAKEMAQQCVFSRRQRKLALWFSEQCWVIPVKCCRQTTYQQTALGYVVVQRLWHYQRLDNGNTLLMFHAEHKGVEVAQRQDSLKDLLDNAGHINACYELQKLKQLQQEQQAGASTQHVGQYWD